MTQSNDVFRTMSQEEAEAFLQEMRDELKPLYKQLERASAETLRLRPVFLAKQPWGKRCGMIRKAMSLRVNADAAAEVLAAFFMERYAEDVAALLDLLGVEHEEGVLSEMTPKQPTKAKLKAAVDKFRAGENAPQRALLVKAFAAQGAVDWPHLDAMVFDLEEAK
ncbi:MAG: hypothetical protein DHS20C21_11290 [Gemmatimonadota bacterium]|nr:MAG: hypothetical protein DHS20C21_11290 [Gemmatimonadota bacterium]